MAVYVSEPCHPHNVTDSVYIRCNMIDAESFLSLQVALVEVLYSHPATFGDAFTIAR